jgi:hypothetical protein
MSNPWGVKLKKTGLNEQRSSEEQMRAVDLEQRQSSIRDLASENTSKINEYGERQGSLAADAMTGQQGRLPGQGGKKKSRKHRKSSRRYKKHRKTRKSRKHHKRH